MATLKVEALPREFYFHGTRIPDPAPQMSAAEIRDLLTPTYPEIATASRAAQHNRAVARQIKQPHCLLARSW